MKNTLIVLSVVFFIFIISFLVKDTLLGGAKYVTLSNEPIYVAVSAGLKSKSHENYTPIEGKDYTITSTHFLNNNSWIVVGVQPVGASADPGLMVLHKIGNSYVSVIGSVGSVSNSLLGGVIVGQLPPNVINYIKNLNND